MKPATTPALRPRFLLMPGLVGLPLDGAEAALAWRDLIVGTVQPGNSPCLDEDVVLGQRPAVDVHLPPGSQVDLIVNRPSGACGGRPPPAPTELRRIAQRFLQFTQDKAADPPADTPINLYVGGGLIETLSTSRLRNHAAWGVCPESGSYAGATCPVSAVDVLRTYPGTLAITIQHPARPCAHPTRLRDMSLRSVTITPRGPQDCTSYFAVELFVNDVGQVTDVNLVPPEP